MNRLSGFLILLFVLSIGIQACKVKKVQESEAPLMDLTTSMIWNKINESNFDYTWYYAKAGSQVTFDGFTLGGQADIRVRRDSAILISIKKFGFELVRTLIRPDSVFALNRLEGSYMAMSIDSLKDSFEIPFEYYQLQRIIVGNKIVNGQSPLSSLTMENGYGFKSAGDQLQINYLLDQNYNVFESRYTDEQGRSFDLLLDDYKEFEPNLYLASQRSFYYPSKENAAYSLQLDIDKIEIDQAKKIKFEIPSSYTKM